MRRLWHNKITYRMENFTMNAYLMGIDLGTTNVKTLLYDTEGRCVCEAPLAYPLHHPHVGWAEQDAKDWWEATAKTIRQAMRQAEGPILSLCVSSQAPTLLPLDEKGNALRPGIIWMDTRAQEICDWMLREHADYLARYGGKTSPYYLLPKLLWFREHEPDLFRCTRHILTTNGYINFRLTGEARWDTLQAARLTQCFDPEKQAWSCDAAEQFDIDVASLCHTPMLPWEIIGRVNAEAAAQTGLPIGVPVLCGTADGIVALLTSGVTRQGEMGLEIGTSAMILMACRQADTGHCRLMHAPQAFPLRELPYVLSSSVNTAGKALSWLAGILEEGRPLSKALKQMNQLAEQAPVGSRGLMFMPYLAGERAPLWDADLRGSFNGLSLQTGKEDMIRAMMEGVAFAVLDSVEEAKKVQAVPDRCFVSGGGARSKLWLRIIASVLNVPLLISNRTAGAPLADVILAGYGIHLYDQLEEAIAFYTHYDESVLPAPEEVHEYRRLYERYKTIQSLMLSHCQRERMIGG